MNSGWQIKKLGDVCSFENGDRGTNYPSKSARTITGIPFINAGHLTDDGIDMNEMDYISRERFDLLGNGKICPEDILFCLRGSLGKVASVGAMTEGAIASSLVIIRPNNSISGAFLLTYLKSQLCADMISEFRNGAAQPNLSAASLKKFNIPIPPLHEQQRIMTVLDEAFAGIAKATDNAKKNLQNARELFESHLQSTFTTKGNGWVEKELGDVCVFENGDRGTNYPSKSARTITGIPFINAGHLADDGIDMDGMDYISRERFNLLGNGKIRPDDILFCLRGSLGKVASVGSLAEGAIASSLVIIRPKASVSGAFLLSYLKSHLCSDMISEFRNGAAQPNLSAGSLKKFSIPVPSLPEQQHIVTQLDALSAETKRLEAIYQHKLDNLAVLKQSILQKAFAGELNMDKLAA